MIKTEKSIFPNYYSNIANILEKVENYILIRWRNSGRREMFGFCAKAAHGLSFRSCNVASPATRLRLTSAARRLGSRAFDVPLLFASLQLIVWCSATGQTPDELGFKFAGALRVR